MLPLPARFAPGSPWRLSRCPFIRPRGRQCLILSLEPHATAAVSRPFARGPSPIGICLAPSRRTIVPRKWTHRACFESYDTVAKNPRWSWSARNEARGIVAVTFWQDRFERGTALYRSHTHSHDPNWLRSPGLPELIENLAWARDNCDGVVRIIIAIPKDRNASPREIKECFPKPEIRMRVTMLNEATGEFVCERIDEAV